MAVAGTRGMWVDRRHESTSNSKTRLIIFYRGRFYCRGKKNGDVGAFQKDDGRTTWLPSCTGFFFLPRCAPLTSFHLSHCFTCFEFPAQCFSFEWFHRVCIPLEFAWSKTSFHEKKTR